VRRLLVVALLFGCAPAPRDPSYDRLVEQAEARVKRAELAPAERSFAEAHRVDPEGIEARYGLAFVKSKRCSKHKRDCEACLADFDAILSEGDYRDSHYNRAQCAFELGRSDEALADLDKAVAKRPNDLDYRMTRALLRLHLKRTAEACEDLAKARTLGADVTMLIHKNCK
jgi:tetratricopeptide (TPR) repeat protein